MSSRGGGYKLTFTLHVLFVLIHEAQAGTPRPDREGLQMDMTLILNFEGQTSVDQIQRRHSCRRSSMGKVWRCENCMWFSEEVTDVNWGVERGVKGGRTRSKAGQAMRRRMGGLQRTPTHSLPQEIETCQAHSFPEAPQVRTCSAPG